MRTMVFCILVTGAASLSVFGVNLTPSGTSASPVDSRQVYVRPDTTLRVLSGYAFEVRHSASVEAKARITADRVASVLNIFGPRLAIRPEVILLVLAPEDWADHTSFPVYGMPHILEGRTLIVAGADNPFWRGFLPDPATLPNDAAAALRRVYDDGAGGLSAAVFFDLLAIHELGHAFTSQAGVRTQRRWMGEFLPNLILHAWVEEAAPELLPALTLLADLVVAAGPGKHPYTTIADIEEHYGRVAREHPENYGWYQLRWQQGARRLYEVGGTEALDRLWAALRDHTDPLDDAAFVALLDNRVHRTLGDFVRNWDSETASPPPLRFRRSERAGASQPRQRTLR
jgi:hypothetical protein